MALPASQLTARSSEEESFRDDSHDSAPPDPARPFEAYEPYELARLRTQYSQTSTARRQSLSRQRSLASQPPTSGIRRLIYDIKRFWRLHVSCVVEYESCRDHLALERTFLGYLRTSLALSMLGVIIAQLFGLDQEPGFGYHTLRKPLGSICQGFAILTLVLGAARYWRLQNAIIRGKAIAGGIELMILGLGTLAMVVMFFVLLIVVSVNTESKPS